MPQTQRRLDQSGHPRGRLEMPEIALDRADHAPVAAPTRLPVHRPEGSRLDGIADRPGSMRFDVLHGTRRNIRQPQGVDDARFLRGSTGNEMPAVRPS